MLKVEGNKFQLSKIGGNPIVSNFYATGGDEVISGGYHYHVFTSNGILECFNGPGNIEIYAIGGGGCGGLGWGTGVGMSTGGGGGAGELIYISSLSIDGTIVVTLGVGGKGVNDLNNLPVDRDGGITTFGSYITAYGGGFGGCSQDSIHFVDDGNGSIGSGGGGGEVYNAGDGSGGISQTDPNYSMIMGFNGGRGTYDMSVYGGGGGGTTQDGGSGKVNTGNGGDGTYISWLSGKYIGGGGCGGDCSGTNNFGGGSSGSYDSGFGGNGLQATGGGGGGTSSREDTTDIYSGNGGSGYIILRYPV